MRAPLVTVVIATYNRPDTLRVAIQSVVRQSIDHWKVLVVGDGCDSRTEKVVGRFDPARVRYINLPDRFGEQSGPNSIGMALSDTEYIALLNHDDILLPDHLERALAELNQKNADIYIGKSMTTKDWTSSGSFAAVPVFSKVDPDNRKPWMTFCREFILFEPCSCFVMRRDTVRKIGRWSSARDIYRTPLQDWLMRAWRQKTRFVFGEVVTVLSLATHHRRKSAAGSYAVSSPEYEYLGQTLTDPELMAELMQQCRGNGLARLKVRGPYVMRPLCSLFVNRLTGLFYYYFGLDMYSLYCRLCGREKGKRLKRATRKRTGSALPVAPDFDTVLERLVRSGQKQ